MVLIAEPRATCTLLTPSAKWNASLCFQFGVQLDGWDFFIVKYACLIIIFHWRHCLLLTLYISCEHRLLITRVRYGVSLGQTSAIYFRISKVWILLYFWISNLKKSDWRDKKWQAWLPSSRSVNDLCTHSLLRIKPSGSMSRPLSSPPWPLLKLSMYSFDQNILSFF